MKVTVLLLVATGTVLAGAGSKKSGWKFAGEDRGVRFFFKTAGKDGRRPIKLKIENTLPRPVDVSFRVRDTDWTHRFETELAPGSQDSSLVYLPRYGYQVRYPFIDQVFMEVPDSAHQDPLLLSLD
jgi:hypothetical protein